MLVELLNANPALFVLTILLVLGLGVMFVSFFISIRVVYRVYFPFVLLLLVFLGVFWSQKAGDQARLSAYVDSILDVSGLPVEIDTGVNLIDIRWNGRNYTNIYQVNAAELVPDQGFVISASCRGAQRISLLALGAVLEHRYLLDGAELQSYEVTVGDCFQ